MYVCVCVCMCVCLSVCPCMRVYMSLYMCVHGHVCRSRLMKRYIYIYFFEEKTKDRLI